MKLKNISQWKRILTNFAQNWKIRYFTVNGHWSFELSDKVIFLWYLSKIGLLLLKLVLEIGTLVLFSSAFNECDLLNNQENKIASSTARDLKEVPSFVIKISRTEKFLPRFFTNKKFRVWTIFLFFKKNIALKRKFLKTVNVTSYKVTLKMWLFCLFSEAKMQFLRNLVWLTLSKWYQSSNNLNV